MNSFTQKREQIVDQRDRKFGPLWHSRTRGAEPPESLGSGVYRSGESRMLAHELIGAIDAAREMIVVASFLFAEGELEVALLNAAKRGVRVYMLLASEARLDAEQSPERDFDKRVLEEHKAMLRKLEGWALIRSAGKFHGKTLLIDPNHGGPGFLLTANLASDPLKRNEEIGVRLDRTECEQIFGYLKWAMWEEAEHDNIEGSRTLVAVKPLGEVRHPASSAAVCVTTAKEQSLRNTAMRLISVAQHEVIISSFGWQSDHPVVQALCERARAGLRVRVLSRQRPASMAALLALREAGAEVVGFKWLHAKAILADGATGLIMSANLERHGLDEGFELGVTVSGARARALHTLLNGWLAYAPFTLASDAKLGDLSGTVHLWNGRNFELATIIEEAALDVGEVIVPSAELVGKLAFPWDLLEAKNGSRPPSHALKVTWTEKAPSLPKGAKPSGVETFGAQLFTDNARRVVAIASESALPAALEMKASQNAAAIVVRHTGK